MNRDLTKGNITGGLVLFALPMIAGDLLQQLYNIADTLIVGKALGRNALAAVGSAYALMTFLTSVFIGLSMGAGALFSICVGRGDRERLRSAAAHAAMLISVLTLLLNAAVYLFLDPILGFLKIPDELYLDMRGYLEIIFAGIAATSVYNFFACLLRADGNSAAPLWFLAVSAVLNIGLDLIFVLVYDYGIAGAAIATVIAQYAAAVGIWLYTARKCRGLLPERRHFKLDREVFNEIRHTSILTSAQQSAMNFGILLIQRLVDSYGAVIMAAFAAAVKIDTFAYLPVQDFGNAFATFAAQNHGAGDRQRLMKGFLSAAGLSAAFSAVISTAVVLFAKPLMGLFISAEETAVVAAGAGYLRIEAPFYALIGLLFLFYGYFRAVERPGVSLILTVISLGTRVLLAYTLSPRLGENGIWLSIPIGWFLADAAGLIFALTRRKPPRRESHAGENAEQP